jgi:hypothetical protein
VQVFPDGSLCLDIIQDKWKPIFTMSLILTSVQSLLCDPNLDSPANVEAARVGEISLLAFGWCVFKARMTVDVALDFVAV